MNGPTGAEALTNPTAAELRAARITASRWRSERLHLRWGYRLGWGWAPAGLSGEERRALRRAWVELLALEPGYRVDRGQAHAALELARAERAATAAGWYVEFAPDEEASREADGAPLWLATLYSSEAEPLASIGAVDVGDAAPLPERGYGRVIAAYLAEEAEARRSPALLAEVRGWARQELQALADRLEEVATGQLSPGDDRHVELHHHLMAASELLAAEAKTIGGTP